MPGPSDHFTIITDFFDWWFHFHCIWIFDAKKQKTRKKPLFFNTFTL